MGGGATRSPRASRTTWPAWRATSRPTSSSSAKGPTGQPQRVMARSTFSMSAPPASIQAASLSMAPRTREVKKPGPSPTTITVLPMVRPTATVVAKASSEVPEWRITSSRGILATGLKKCMPTTRSGWRLGPGVAAGLGDAGDGDRRGVGGEDQPLGRHRLGLAQDGVLDREVLEDRLDHEVAPRQRLGL